MVSRYSISGFAIGALPGFSRDAWWLEPQFAESVAGFFLLGIPATMRADPRREGNRTGVILRMNSAMAPPLTGLTDDCWRPFPTLERGAKKQCASGAIEIGACLVSEMVHAIAGPQNSLWDDPGGMI
jgi:hypothetical protein